MCLTVLIILAAIFLIWLVNGIRPRKDQTGVGAAFVHREREAQRLYDAGQITLGEKFRIIAGERAPSGDHDSDGLGFVRPSGDSHDSADFRHSGTAAFWEQQEELARQHAIRRDEEDRKWQWREEENRRRDEDRRREDEYWEQRRQQEDNY